MAETRKRRRSANIEDRRGMGTPFFPPNRWQPADYTFLPARYGDELGMGGVMPYMTDDIENVQRRNAAIAARHVPPTPRPNPRRTIAGGKQEPRKTRTVAHGDK